MSATDPIGPQVEEPPRATTATTPDDVLTPAQQADPAPEPATLPVDSLAPGFVYALGQIEPRFPSLGVEKEFAQVAGQSDASGLTDRQALHALLSEPGNRYLARQLCWVLTIQGLDTYILRPRVPDDIQLLVDAVRPTPRRTDVDVVIGVLGPIAPPEMCNALMVPIVVVDHIYSFDVESLLEAIPRPRNVKADQFEASNQELFSRITQMNDNAGATDADRALNYLTVRYPAIYHKTAERFAANSSLRSVQVRPSRLAATRNIVDVVFAYTDRATDVTEKEFVRVDVTEEFPFLASKIAPHFEREG